MFPWLKGLTVLRDTLSDTNNKGNLGLNGLLDTTSSQRGTVAKRRRQQVVLVA